MPFCQGKWWLRLGGWKVQRNMNDTTANIEFPHECLHVHPMAINTDIQPEVVFHSCVAGVLFRGGDFLGTAQTEPHWKIRFVAPSAMKQTKATRNKTWTQHEQGCTQSKQNESKSKAKTKTKKSQARQISSKQFRTIQIHSIRFNSSLFSSIRLSSIPFHSIPFHSIPFHSSPFELNKCYSTQLKVSQADPTQTKATEIKLRQIVFLDPSTLVASSRVVAEEKWRQTEPNQFVTEVENQINLNKSNQIEPWSHAQHSQAKRS